MNHKQRVSIWLAIGAIVVLILFPPWHRKYRGTDEYSNNGYKLIFSLKDDSTSIDYSRLILPIGAIAIIALGLIVTFKDKKPE